ncbi:hypothetical protein ACAW74_18055 [Fibrella sp. WM1]|uniref:hypothetical protein n=1 Tax=Fibrella musci TaxID=3242485 RepID=UPI00352226F0
MNVRFIARTSQIHKTRCTIQARISVNGVRGGAFSTGIELNKADWNARLQQVKGRSTSAQTDNQRIEWIRAKLFSIYHHFEAKGRAVTADMIKETYTGKRRLEYTLAQLVERFLDHKKRSIGQPGGITKTSYEAYQDRLGNLTTYLETIGKTNTLLADATSAAFAVEWQAHLLKTYKVNYVAKHFDLLKQVLDYGVMMELIMANRLHGWKPKREKPGKPIYLTQAEIEQLAGNDLNSKPELLVYRERMIRARDLFLFMCATGMHYAEMKKLTDADIYTLDGQRFFIQDRQKTGKELIVPVTSLADRLLTKYGCLANMPRMANAKLNLTLKLVMIAADVKTHLTCKVGRKSFTDYFLNERKWSKDQVRKMLGLSSTRFLDHYGDIDHRALRLVEPADLIEA